MITQRPDHLVRNPESPFLAAEPVLKAKRASHHLRLARQGDAALIFLILHTLPPLKDKLAHAELRIEDHGKINKCSLPGTLLTATP